MQTFCETLTVVKRNDPDWYKTWQMCDKTILKNSGIMHLVLEYW